MASVKNIYRKKEGTTAGEGLMYERLICMQVISRCAANDFGFELKCNVADEERIFVDVVCKITDKQISAQEKARHLFLQAKHFTGKYSTIFIQSKKDGIKPKEGTFPAPDIYKWFESYLQLSRAHPGEVFEMVCFTTADIEPEWKCHFEEAESIFADILSTENLATQPSCSAKGRIYKLKNCTPVLKSKFESEASDGVVQNFLKSLRIFTLQPTNSNLECLIKSENVKEGKPNTDLVYNMAYKEMEAWQIMKENVPVISHNIFAEAETTAGIEIIKYIESTEWSEGDYTYNKSTVDEFYKKILHNKYMFLRVKDFSIYKDLIKQTIREKDRNLNFFIILDFFSISDRVINALKSIQYESVLYIKIEATNKLKLDSKAQKNLQTLLDDLRVIPKVFVMIAVDPLFLKSKTCAEIFSQRFRTISLGFSNLDNGTKSNVLSQEVEFFGENIRLTSLILENEKFFDREILGDIRDGLRISIGTAIKMKDSLSATYIERYLYLYNRIRNSKDILESTCLKDKYVIFSRESEVKCQASEGDTTVLECESREGAILHEDLSQTDKEMREVVSVSDSEIRSNSVSLFFEIEELQAIEKFNDQSTTHPDQGHHLLRQENGTLHWLQSRNHCQDDIQYLIDKSSTCELKEDELIKDFIGSPLCSKVLLVSSNAGMGKSILAMSLAGKLTKNETKYWPVLINLNQFQHLLEQMSQNKEDISKTKPETLLEQFLDEVHIEMFRRCTLAKVVVLLDGLDEISPVFTDLVLKIVKILSLSDVQKILVLTRQHMADDFLRSISAMLFDLKTFTGADIANYFYMTYRTISCSRCEEEKKNAVKKFVSKLLEVMLDSSRSHWLEINGVPLQAYMIAEAFRERCAQYLETQDKEYLPSEKDANIDIYQAVIRTKFNVSMSEKHEYKLIAIHEKTKKKFDEIVEKHSKISIVLIFGKNISQKHFKIKAKQGFTDKAEEILRYGIITSFSKDYVEFVHRSFAEYFCAEQIYKILVNRDSSQHIDLISKVFLSEDCKVVRKFLDIKLIKGKEYLNFNLMGRSVLKRRFEASPDKIYTKFLWLCVQENCLYLLRELLRYTPKRILNHCKGMHIKYHNVVRKLTEPGLTNINTAYLK